MSTLFGPSLFDHENLTPRCGRTFITPSLWFVDSDGYRVVYLRHEVLFRFALTDLVQISLVAVMLRQSNLATQVEIASAFGHSVATQRRWETNFARFGIDGLRPKPRTGRPSKLDASQEAFVMRWFHQGLSNAEMARRLGVSESTIRRFLRSAGLRRQIPPAPELPLAIPHSAPNPVEPTLAEPLSPVVPEPAPPQATPSAHSPTPTVVPETAAALPTPSASVVVPETMTVLPTPSAPFSVSSPVPSAAVPVPIATVPPAPAPDANPPPSPPPPIPPVLPPTEPVFASPGFTVDTDPSDRSGDRAMARLGFLEDAVPLFGNHLNLANAGVLLAVPVIQTHGCLPVFARVFGSLGKAFYGLRTVVLSLLVMALLRIKRPECLKEYSPTSLGRIIGLDRILEVKTLRRKLTEMADQEKGHQLLGELARLRLAQDEERLALFYFDGHVREYSGKAELAKAKKAQRSVATRAATDNWLHDASGQPLLLFTCEMNEGLTQILEEIIVDVKTLVPKDARLTAVFDRGGWSPKLFKRLQDQGTCVITYRKGKTQTFPEAYFSDYEVEEDGKKKTYKLYDQPRVKVGRLRPAKKSRPEVGDTQFFWMRQVTVLREDGRQTNILTNRDDLAAVDVVIGLFRRWRQENYFKYMEEEFALDALVEYEVEEVSEEQTRPNPEWKELAKQRQKAKAEVARLQAQLGAKAEANKEQNRPSMRGFKIANADLRKELKEAQLRLEELTEQQKEVGKRTSAEELETLTTEKKLIVDAIKIIAYQVETELLKRLSKYYLRAEDEGRTLLHAAFKSSATIERTETELRVTIAAQSSPHRSAALAQLCHELNQEGQCFPGTNLRMHLAVEGQEPLIS